jgi:hypothetical protein
MEIKLMLGKYIPKTSPIEPKKAIEPEKAKDTNPLPDSVTEEPQAEEHMHLKHIIHSPSLVEVYLGVSDDEGNLLENVELERQVIGFIEQYLQTEVESNSLDSVLDELRNLYKRYSIKVNKTDSISTGVVTKYRIRQGMLLNIEKRLTKMNDKGWIDHFVEIYGRKHLRTAQDYMSLAKIPNIIKYAVYGKERLMEIKRAIKTLGISGEDPVAAFLAQYGIPFDPEDPENEESLAELKMGIDAAVAMAKIKKIEERRPCELGARPDLIKKIVGLGIAFGNGIIEDMVIVKESNGDVNQHLENVYIAGGKGEAIIKSTKSVQGFPKLVASFKTTVDYIRENADLVEIIDRTKIDELERAITDLKALIDNPSNNN